MHWTLAESLNTSATLYAATGEEMYANWYATFAQYVDEHVIDHESGSWFHQLDKNNHVIGTVWPGKSDLYHAFQSTLIPSPPRSRTRPDRQYLSLLISFLQRRWPPLDNEGQRRMDWKC